MDDGTGKSSNLQVVFPAKVNDVKKELLQNKLISDAELTSEMRAEKIGQLLTYAEVELANNLAAQNKLLKFVEQQQGIGSLLAAASTAAAGTQHVVRQESQRVIDAFVELINRERGSDVTTDCFQSSGPVSYDRDHYPIGLEAVLELKESSFSEVRLGHASAVLPKNSDASSKNKSQTAERASLKNNSQQIERALLSGNLEESLGRAHSVSETFASVLPEASAFEDLVRSTHMEGDGVCSSVGSLSEPLSALSDHGRRRTPSLSGFKSFKTMELEQFESCIVSPNIMLQKRRSSMVSHQNVWPLGGIRDCLRAFVSSTRFVSIVASAIVLNAIFMGIQTDYGGKGGDEDAVFHMVDVVFAVVFLIELLLRIAAEGRKIFEGKERTFNIFDSIIVIITIFEVVILSSISGLNTVSSLRLVRIVRIFKMLRFVKLAQIFRPLRIMIKAILGTLRSLIWALFLLTGIMYIFALLFTNAALDAISRGDVREEPLKELYGTVPRSMWSLFQSMSGGADWGEGASLLGEIGLFYLFMFIVYICFVSFAVLNLITGHFCHTAIECAATDMELVLQEHQRRTGMYQETLARLFRNIDVLQSDLITLNDFKGALERQEIRDFFHSLEIDISDAWDVFKLMDRDANRGVDMNEFISGCFQLRGPAKSVELAKLSYAVNWLTTQFSEFVEYFAAVEPMLKGADINACSLNAEAGDLT